MTQNLKQNSTLKVKMFTYFDTEEMTICGQQCMTIAPRLYKTNKTAEDDCSKSATIMLICSCCKFNPYSIAKVKNCVPDWQFESWKIEMMF